METRLLPYSDQAIAEAARLILAGEPVAIATETVYGLAADATNAEAVARIYEAKGRPSFNPLIVHVIDLAAAETLETSITRRVDLRNGIGRGRSRLSCRFDPSRASRRSRPPVCPRWGCASLAIQRCALAGSDAAAACRALGQRERLDQRDPRRACDEEPWWADRADYRCRTDRAGARIDDRCGNWRTAQAASARSDRHRCAGGARRIDRSPGAAGKPLRAIEAGPPQCVERRGRRISDRIRPNHRRIRPSALSGDLVEAAARLFDLLHRADASDKRRIAVAPVPDRGLGAAINDRLRRAAA